MRDEHRPTSDIFKHDHLTNDYVSASANRFNLAISEATNETLRAVTLQVALSIFLDYVTDLFTHTVTSTFHTFTNQEKATGTCSSQEAADSSRHQIWISTFIGVVSLTFAQYNRYMIRHSNDATLGGKMVYLLACFMNTVAIFLTQIVYVGIGKITTANVNMYWN